MDVACCSGGSAGTSAITSSVEKAIAQIHLGFSSHSKQLKH